jgi:hypothetical protein
MLTELPKEVLELVLWYMPLGGVPSRRLLILGRVSKKLRMAVKGHVEFQLRNLHGKQYCRLKRAYMDV